MAKILEEKEPKTTRTWLIILIGAAGFYLASTLIANVASLRIIKFGGFSLDAGTFIYPITFTLRDVIHKVGGRAAARAAIWTGAGVNLLMASYFWLVAQMNPDMYVGAQTEWVKVLGPQWRIVLASIFAMLLAELVDTSVYGKFVARFGHKYQFGRVLTSNAISVPLDSALFTAVAFYGALPNSVCISIFWSMVWIKMATSVLSAPLIYGVRPKQEWTLEGQIR